MTEVVRGAACSLGDLAAQVGWAASDMSMVSGVSKSSLARWWSDPDWLEHASGAGLQMLASSVPGVREYVDKRTEYLALSRAIEMCGSAGASVSFASLRALWESGIPASELIPALLAGAALSDDSAGERAAVAALSRCWGNAAERALDAVFTSIDRGGVFADTSTLVRSAERLQHRRGDSMVEVVGRGIALHKLIKHFAVNPNESSGVGGAMARAFRYRSSVIGTVLADGDVDRARAYSNRLMRDPVLRWNEVWSLASYAGDFARDDAVYRPAPPGGLRRTSARLLGELTSADDAYRTYLLICAIPLLSSYDPTFGGHREDLHTAVEHLRDTKANAATGKAAESILQHLRDVAGTVAG